MNLIPELRFPEFTGKDGWKNSKLLDVLFEHKETSDGSEEVYSVSVHKGIVNQIEHLGRRFAASSTDNYKRVLPGDVVYTKSPTGDFPFGIIKQNKSDKPVIVSPLYGVFTPETKWLGLIIDAYFESPQRTYNYLESIVQKGAKNTINIRNDVFLSKHLVLPRDREEQQKIASCLSSLDELIAAHNDKLDALKDHKKGLLQNLFPQEGETVPKLRFPEFEGDGEWDSDSLVNLAQFRRGSFPQPYGLPEWYDDEDGMPFIQVYDVDDNFRLKPSTKRKISELAAEQSVFIEKGTVIITIQGSIGRVAITQYDAYIDRTLLIFQEFYDEIDKTFFAYTLFLLFEIEKQKAPGGIIKTITKQVLSDFTIKMPSLEEQKKIASCLSAVDELINAQSEKIEELNQHKRGLMQGLFPKIES